MTRYVPNRRPIETYSVAEQITESVIDGLIDMLKGKSDYGVATHYGYGDALEISVVPEESHATSDRSVMGGSYDRHNEQIEIVLDTTSARKLLRRLGEGEYRERLAAELESAIGHELVHAFDPGLKNLRDVDVHETESLKYSNSPHEVRAYGWNIARAVAKWVRSRSADTPLTGEELYKAISLLGGTRYEFYRMTPANKRIVAEMVWGHLLDEGLV